MWTHYYAVHHLSPVAPLQFPEMVEMVYIEVIIKSPRILGDSKAVSTWAWAGDVLKASLCLLFWDVLWETLQPWEQKCCFSDIPPTYQS